jgi:uncharacterized membrane protein YozB (DUF420 family)
MQTNELMKSVRAAYAIFPASIMIAPMILVIILLCAALTLIYLRTRSDHFVILMTASAVATFFLLYLSAWFIAAALRRLRVVNKTVAGLQGLRFLVIGSVTYLAILAAIILLLQRLLGLTSGEGIVVVLMFPAWFSLGISILAAIEITTQPSP